MNRVVSVEPDEIRAARDVSHHNGERAAQRRLIAEEAPSSDFEMALGFLKAEPVSVEVVYDRIFNQLFGVTCCRGCSSTTDGDRVQPGALDTDRNSRAALGRGN